jgi:hypothetical protein
VGRGEVVEVVEVVCCEGSDDGRSRGGRCDAVNALAKNSPGGKLESSSSQMREPKICLLAFFFFGENMGKMGP